VLGLHVLDQRPRRVELTSTGRDDRRPTGGSGAVVEAVVDVTVQPDVVRYKEVGNCAIYSTVANRIVTRLHTWTE